MTFARFVSVSRSRLAILLRAKLGDASELVSVARNVYSTEKEALRHPKPLSTGDPNAETPQGSTSISVSAIKGMFVMPIENALVSLLCLVEHQRNVGIEISGKIVVTMSDLQARGTLESLERHEI